MSRFLILTADDFGLHEAVNDAVCRASTDGALTCASLMVGAPAAADAIRKAHELPGLRVGLHLVLTDGWSVLSAREIPDLVSADGRFGRRMVTDGFRFFALPAVRRQLEDEIRAQFTRFAASGLALDHVNTHKHFHLHPAVCAMILAVGREFGLRAIRIPREPLWFALRENPLGAVRTALLAPWVGLMSSRLRSTALTTNDQLFGISSSGRTDEQVLLRILSRLPAGISEIYLHPALPTASPIAASMRTYRHADEFQALMSPAVKEAIAAANVRAGGYADCAPPGGPNCAPQRIPTARPPADPDCAHTSGSRLRTNQRIPE